MIENKDNRDSLASRRIFTAAQSKETDVDVVIKWVCRCFQFWSLETHSQTRSDTL